MNVVHAILNDSPDLFQTLKWPHCCDSISLKIPEVSVNAFPCHYHPTLHKDIAVRKYLDSLKSSSVGTNKPLPPFDKPLFVAHQVAYLDHIAGHAVIQDLHRLDRRSYGSPRVAGSLTCWAGTLLANNLIRSLALSMA